LWGHVLLLVPYVSMINALAGYGIYHQLISDPAFACFVYLSATQMFWWNFFGRRLNSEPMRLLDAADHDGAKALRHAIKRAVTGVLVSTCVAYALLVPPLVLFLQERRCGFVDKLAGLTSDLLTLDSLVIWTLQYYVGAYTGCLVCVDSLAVLLLSVHADGFGEGKGYAGLESVKARLATDTSTRVKAVV